MWIQRSPFYANPGFTELLRQICVLGHLNAIKNSGLSEISAGVGGSK